MAPSDSEDETLEDLEYDGEDDPDGDAEEEPIDGGLDDGTEGDEDSSDESDSGSEDDDDEEDNDSETFAETAAMDVDQVSQTELLPNRKSPSPASIAALPRTAAPVLPLPTARRSLSPEQLRRNALIAPIGSQVPSGSYTVEAICALQHPVPTHALASSWCMTHLLTGSDDGYIRDYDIFSAINSKVFLTAPQRHHSGVVEGIMKAGQLRCWWENPVPPESSKLSTIPGVAAEPPSLSPVYSLAMHSDALWTLAGSNIGHINLFTTRHDPGRVFCTMNGHRGPVSALSMSHDEKGFFSAGWDGDAIQWDLNNGQRVRTFTSHGAQLAAIAVRPLGSGYSESNSTHATTTQSSNQDMNGLESATLSSLSDPHGGDSTKEPPESDTKSDASFDPLFDDEPEGQIANDGPQQLHQKSILGSIPPPKNAPPLLNSVTYAAYSSDLLMTASIDGQVILWDRRVEAAGNGVGRLWMSEKTPPWCLSACWSADGGQIYAGRRNGTIDVWDVRLLGRSGPRTTPRLLKTLKNPPSSGVVSCIVAFPDCRHIACASVDNLRLWNVAEASEPDSSGKVKTGVQFKIIPGHHGGHISQLLIDPGARFLVSASSNRGWHGDATRTVFVHDIKRAQ